MADRSLMDMSLDISAMNLDWVAGTTDKLFNAVTGTLRAIWDLVHSLKGKDQRRFEPVTSNLSKIRQHLPSIVGSRSSIHDQARTSSCYAHIAFIQVARPQICGISDSVIH